jgi:hypothetical protein
VVKLNGHPSGQFLKYMVVEEECTLLDILKLNVLGEEEILKLRDNGKKTRY